jgi:hypothetical protein
MKTYSYHLDRSVEGVFTARVFQQIDGSDYLIAKETYVEQSEVTALHKVQDALRIYRAYAKQEVAA